MKMLDLFSGLGGASQAFEAAGWEVVTVDINPEFNPTICCNVEDLWLTKEFKSWSKNEFDLVWASPPCVEFYKVLAPFFPEYYGKQPSMELVEESMAYINLLKPTWWVLENTKSGSEFIKKKLGARRQKFGPFFLWGNFPKFDAKIDLDHKTKNDVWSNDPLRSNKRAKVPYQISIGLLNAIENQSILNLEWEP